MSGKLHKIEAGHYVLGTWEIRRWEFTIPFRSTYWRIYEHPLRPKGRHTAEFDTLDDVRYYLTATLPETVKEEAEIARQSAPRKYTEAERELLRGTEGFGDAGGRGETP